MMKEILSFNKRNLRHSETQVKSLPVVDVPEDDEQPQSEPVRRSSTIKKGSDCFHGILADPLWPKPDLLTECDIPARPGYQTESAHEYYDTPDVLTAKIELLATMLSKSKNAMVYSGAGISTGAGINDYATKGGMGLAKKGKSGKPSSPITASPTQAHLALTGLFRSKHIKHWVQQNHDGLPQKAGFPQSHMNEIHGAWFDPSNPVVKMSGNLRTDLFEWMLEWEHKADLTLAVGTSMCGMNADRVAQTVGEKAKKGLRGIQGLVIINLQKTRLDHVASLRIFASLDEVLPRVAALLDSPIPTPIDFTCDENDVDAHRMNVPYDPRTGKRSRTASCDLDLNIDQRVRVIGGPYDACEGSIAGINNQGHYRLVINVMVKGNFAAPVSMMLGRWWLLEAKEGSLSQLPLVNL